MAAADLTLEGKPTLEMIQSIVGEIYEGKWTFGPLRDVECAAEGAVIALRSFHEQLTPMMLSIREGQILIGYGFFEGADVERPLLEMLQEEIDGNNNAKELAAMLRTVADQIETLKPGWAQSAA